MSEKTTSKATATKDLTGNVQRLLEALSRQKSVEPLKQLFWSELNYERANQPLSYRNWPEQTANVLYEAPLLFATGGIDDSFHIIYIRMESDQLSLKDEWLVVTRLLKDHLYLLFIFSNKSQDRWHFLNSKPDDKRLILDYLFFSGLNTDNYVNIVDINRNGFLQKVISDVPYLNGGLFEKDGQDDNPALSVPDECIEAILHELFDRFNFTITESTPLDIEVAVDPEMLGKVFEELVTGRKARSHRTTTIIGQSERKCHGNKQRAKTHQNQL